MKQTGTFIAFRRLLALKFVATALRPYILPRTLPRRLSKTTGGRCEPAFLPWVLHRLAECRGVAVDSDAFVDLAAALHANSLRVFRLNEASSDEKH